MPGVFWKRLPAGTSRVALTPALIASNVRLPLACCSERMPPAPAERRTPPTSMTSGVTVVPTTLAARLPLPASSRRSPPVDTCVEEVPALEIVPGATTLASPPALRSPIARSADVLWMNVAPLESVFREPCTETKKGAVWRMLSPVSVTGAPAPSTPSRSPAPSTLCRVNWTVCPYSSVPVSVDSSPCVPSTKLTVPTLASLSTPIRVTSPGAVASASAPIWSAESVPLSSSESVICAAGASEPIEPEPESSVTLTPLTFGVVTPTGVPPAWRPARSTAYFSSSSVQTASFVNAALCAVVSVKLKLGSNVVKSALVCQPVPSSGAS